MTNKKLTKTPAKTKTASSKKRQLRPPVYKSFRRSKKLKAPATKILPGSFKLFISSIRLIRQNWQLFLTITFIYGLLTIILVRGISNGLNLSDVKAGLKGGFNGHYSQLATGTVLFSYLLGSSDNSSTATSGVYQTLLVIIMSLIIIWSLRQVLAGHAIKARDAFYNGTYPLIQFILVILNIGLQLLPLAIGAWLYSAVNRSGIATSALEQFVWLVFVILLVIFSLYMITSSLFAAYIVTLPDMTPMKALRSARALVKHRRWTVLRKILFLPMALLILGAVIMIPIIMLLTPIAQWIFFALSMFALVVVHTYMYSLYRELL